MKFCVGKSTSVLLTLPIPALSFPLSNCCCRCEGVVWRNGCQVADGVTDVRGAAYFSQSASTLKSVNTGLTEFW